MSFSITGYSGATYMFNHISSAYTLENRSGVYLVIDSNAKKILDIGESATVRDRVENHDRKSCWERHSTSPIKYAVCYISSPTQRFSAEQDLRAKFKPPCGKS